MKSDRVDVICVDSQFVRSAGLRLVRSSSGRMPTIPVVLILDDAPVPGNLQELCRRRCGPRRLPHQRLHS